MATLAQKLKEKRQNKTLIESPLFGARERVETIVKEEVGKFKTEIIQELKRMLEEKIGEDGITKIEGKRGFSPVLGQDFLTPKDMAKIRRDAQGKSGRNAKEVDVNFVISQVLSMIPKPKAGKDGDSVTLEMLRELLKPELEEIKRQIVKSRKKGGGGSGGGMGLVVHETFTINAGTSSVETEFPISGGTAIFTASYQGQNIELTNHYTVSAVNRKTITFHTDVQGQFKDDTVFYISYVRGS